MPALRNYLGGQDSTFFTYEFPNYPSGALNFWALDRHVTEADGRRYALDLAEHAGDRLLCRLVRDQRPGGRPYFERDPEFSVDKIFSFVRLDRESTVDDVTRHAYANFAFQYDYKNPLWALRLYEYGDAKSMIVFRFHHSVMDGQGFFKAWAEWSAKTDGGVSNPRFRSNPIGNPFVSEPPVAPLPPSEEEFAVLVAGMQRDAEKYGTARVSPYHDAEEKRKHGMITRQVATSSAMPLSELKRFKKVLGCDGLNDTIIAALAGAYTKLLRKHGLPVDEYLCFLIPVSFRDPAKDPDLCNRIGWYIVYVPSFIESIVDRARAVSKVTTDAKNAKEADIAYKATVATVCPWDVDSEATTGIYNRLNAVVSSVPESTYPLSFGPAKITSCIPTGPVGAPGCANITLYCLNEQLQLAIVLDHDPDAEDGFFGRESTKEFCRVFDAEYRELVRRVDAIEADLMERRGVGVEARL